ncbi:MAG: DMT family transporter [Elusimicrobiales bacterium]
MTPVASLWTNWFFTATAPLAWAYAVRWLSPVALTFCCALLGFAYFLPWIIRNGALRGLFSRRLMFPLFVMGFFGGAVPVALLCFALKYTTAANAAIIAQVEVVYSLILSRLLLHEKFTPVKFAGAALVITGTLMIAFRERFTPRWTGDCLVLIAPVFYQLSHVAAKRLPKEIRPEFIAAARGLYASIALLPVVAVAAALGPLAVNPPAAVLPVVVWAGLIVNGLGNLFWYRAIRGMELSRATVIILSYPVLTFILSAALGMERAHLYQAGGLACALAGAYLATRHSEPVPSSPRQEAVSV